MINNKTGKHKNKLVRNNLIKNNLEKKALIQRNMLVKSIISFILTLAMLTTGISPIEVWAATFSYGWVGSAATGGSFSFADGTNDSAGWGYTISGTGIVYCVNQGSPIYQNDNYSFVKNETYVSDGATDMSFEAVIAKICYYNVQNGGSFARSLTQALLWQAYDKGYYSKRYLKSIIEQSSASDSGALYEKIFNEDGEITAKIAVYKSAKSGTQRMLSLVAQKEEVNVKFSYKTYKKSMTFRQIIKLHKVDAYNKPISGVVFAFRLSEVFDNLSSITMQKGTLLVPKDVENVSKGFDECLETDADGSKLGTNVTKSADQIKDMYTRAAGTVVIFAKTDSNGDIRIRLSYKAESKSYAYGRYKKDGDDAWTYVTTSNQYEKLSDNTNSDVMYNGHTYAYLMKKAFEDAGIDAGWAGFKNRCICNANGRFRMDASGNSLDKYSDLREVYENIESYIGIWEVLGENGNSYYDNTLSVNPDLDSSYKWIKITKDESYLSVDDGVLGADKKSVSYKKAGDFISGTGGSYTNSDFVNRDNNEWLKTSDQENNENYYSIDGTKVTTLDFDGNGNIIEGYYEFSIGRVNGISEEVRSFNIHKMDEDGNDIEGAVFEVVVDAGYYAKYLDKLLVNEDEYLKSDNKWYINDNKVCFTALSNKDGNISFDLKFKKVIPDKIYGFGRYYDYSYGKYMDVENESVWKNLSFAQKSGIQEVVNKAYADNKFEYYDISVPANENGKVLARAVVNKEILDFQNEIKSVNMSFNVKETGVLSRDEIAINEEYLNGLNIDGDSTEIIDKYKYYSVKIIKKDSDNNKLLSGAVFEIYEDREFKIPATVYDENGKKIELKSAPKYITKNGIVTTDYFRCSKDKKYYLKEVKAPTGYISIYDDGDLDNDVITFCCDGGDIADSIVYSKNLMEIEIGNNNESEIIISKMDIAGSKEIEGCLLEILDEDEKKIESFISGSKPKTIKDLEFEKVYILREKRPADGYFAAEDIIFKIVDNKEDSSSKVYIYDKEKDSFTGKDNNEIIMYDEQTSVLFKKVDEETGSYIKGAKINIKDEDGNIVYSFISKNEAEECRGILIAGKTYIMSEIIAPSGYEVADDITFTVSFAKESMEIVMKDKRVEKTYGNERNKKSKGSGVIIKNRTSVPKTGREVISSNVRSINTAPDKMADSLVMMLKSGCFLIMIIIGYYIIRFKKLRDN